MIVYHLLLILHKKYSFISLCLKPELWQKVAKFKGAEYFRKALYISIENLYSVLCWSTFGMDYSLESSWVWRYKLGTPVFGESLPSFFADPRKLCQVGLGVLLHSYFQFSSEMFHLVQVNLRPSVRSWALLSRSSSRISQSKLPATLSQMLICAYYY